MTTKNNGSNRNWKPGRADLPVLHGRFGMLMLSVLTITLAGCKQISEADKIVNRCIEAHGGSLYDHMFASFDFRQRHYTIKRLGGIFEYTRTFTDSTGTVRDVLGNEGFQRYINDAPVALTEEESSRYANSVNSVAYFFLLPKPLHDPAVRKTLLTEQRIDGTPYYRVFVRFDQEGGGKDHSDTFVYWINKETFTMDYLAYSYETESGGFRFRKATNRRQVDGILIADYVNLKPRESHGDIADFADLYAAGKLEKVSEIVNQNVRIEIL